MRMRIISGYLKGRLITVPQSKFIRPTTDRVRETLFNILNNKIDFENIRVLDLYSGSGSLGIECISRGAESVSFIEKNKLIYFNLIENLKILGIENKCEVIRADAVTFTKKHSTLKYDLILADPPFFEFDIYDVLKNVIRNNLLTKNGLMIIERSIQTKEKDIKEFSTEPFRIIGDACLYEITNLNKKDL